MIASTWPDWFMSLHRQAFEGTYCAFDLETSGYMRDKDVITEIAHVLVEDGKVTDKLSLIIDWTDHQVIPDHWLYNRLEDLKRRMAANGRVSRITYERMKREGIKPAEALPFYRDFFETLKKRGVHCLAHNGYAWDEQMLESNFAGFEVVNDFNFGDNGLIDTDYLERANQIPTHPRTKPWPGDTLRSYYKRLSGLRLAGLKSNLDDHCLSRYKFCEHGIKTEDMHQALTDSFCLHLMMTAWRKELAEAPKKLTSVTSAPLPVPPAKVILTKNGLVPSQRKRGQRNR